jgi:hypothetical protein
MDTTSTGRIGAGGVCQSSRYVVKRIVYTVPVSGMYTHGVTYGAPRRIRVKGGRSRAFEAREDGRRLPHASQTSQSKSINSLQYDRR